MRGLTKSLAVLGLMSLTWSQVRAAETIKIGTIFSHTGGGAVLSYSALAAARLAVSEINKTGGILGKQVQLVLGDDRSDASMAVLEARRLLVQEKVDLILGPLGSLTTLPVLPVLTEARIANVSVAQAKQITPQLAPYHFTLVVNTDEIAKVYIEFAVKQLGAKRIAVLIDKTAGQKALLESFKSVINEFPDAKIVAIQEFELEATDQLPHILSLREQKPDVILHSSLAGHDAGVSLSALGDIGWRVPIILSTSAANALPAVVAVAGAGALSADHVYAWDYKSLTYCQGDAVGESNLAKFLQRMYEFAPEVKGKLSATNALWIYDGLHFLAAGVNGAGAEDGVKVADWLEKNSSQLKGVLGAPTASKDSHFMFGASSLGVIKDIGNIRSDGLRKQAGC